MMDVIDPWLKMDLRLIWETEDAFLLASVGIPNSMQKHWVPKSKAKKLKVFMHELHQWGSFDIHEDFARRFFL